GMPWELGLSETHATLVERGLRNRVKLRVDGGLRSGLDIIKASVMGANEFAFGTLALLAQGCIMARVCHTNNCPVGIATQKEKLRERFPGDPDTVVQFFKAIAEEVRFILASMGYRSLSELTGRVDLVRLSTEKAILKTEKLDLQNCFKPEGPSSFCGILERSEEARSLNETILATDEIKEAVVGHGSAFKSFAIKNTDRTVGASLSGAIAKRYGDYGFRGKIVLNFQGAAGQSFGAFNVRGVRLNLLGEANDYVGKGMCGGEIVIKQGENAECTDSPSNGKEPTVLDSVAKEISGRDVLIGNTALYGATGGRLFVAGKAGERFAVRNSNALAVVEGAGDHLCEYMTG
ncbi:MAG TPA: glutamate synthase-related protein, partial [Candidatus Melainabacteria bacterium]|nr:glutamate synthase-related protein [Candidatus Melainabacteria bacterium]